MNSIHGNSAISTTAKSPILSPLQEAALRIKGPQIFAMLWDNVLTPEERERVGGDCDAAYSKHRYAPQMWMTLRGVSFERAVIEVAYQLNFLTPVARERLLRDIGELFDDDERTIDAARTNSRLAIIDSPREVVWKGETLDIKWDKCSAIWNFLVELCKKSKRLQTVTHLDLGNDVDRSSLSTRKSRLVSLPGFPAAFRNEIEHVPNNGYRLKLPPSAIRVFHDDGRGRKTEWTG